LTSNATCTSGNPATSNVVTMVVEPATLSVDPSNRNVLSSAGTTTFNVTSNTSWTVISDQPWCTVDPSGTGNGTINVNFTENTSITARIANVTVTVTGLTPVTVTVTQAGAGNKVLDLTLYLEGLYNTATGQMNQAQGISGAQFGAGIADQVTVELHDAGTPFGMIYSYSNINLNVNGTLVINTIPVSLTGSYYLVIKHRNSLETWSAAPVDFSGAGPILYDFSSAITQAYGSNMKPMGSVFVIWGGDANQDGIVDGADMSAIYNASQPPALLGYNPEDVNGDGIVDGADMSMIYNNSQPPPAQVVKP
jgi:hypothetical protein